MTRLITNGQFRWGKTCGLTAVARLVDLLGLVSERILRMGGVPSSTFYERQKNSNSVSAATVTRLLDSGQVAIIDEVLGRERVRGWVLSAERREKLRR